MWESTISEIRTYVSASANNLLLFLLKGGFLNRQPLQNLILKICLHILKQPTKVQNVHKDSRDIRK